MGGVGGCGGLWVVVVFGYGKSLVPILLLLVVYNSFVVVCTGAYLSIVKTKTNEKRKKLLRVFLLISRGVVHLTRYVSI